MSRRDEPRAELDGLTWEQREAAAWEDLVADEDRRLKRSLKLKHWGLAWNMACFITWVLHVLFRAVGVNPGLRVTTVYFALMPVLMWAVKRWFDSEQDAVGWPSVKEWLDGEEDGVGCEAEDSPGVDGLGGPSAR